MSLMRLGYKAKQNKMTFSFYLGALFALRLFALGKLPAMENMCGKGLTCQQLHE